MKKKLLIFIAFNFGSSLSAKAINGLIILMMLVTFGASTLIMQCDNQPHNTILPGVFAPHPEANKGMLLQPNYAYLNEENEEVYQIAIVGNQKYNALDSYYGNNKDGSLISNTLVPESWQGDDWICYISFPDNYTATVTYYSASYEGGKDTCLDQFAINITSSEYVDTQVSIDEFNQPVSMALKLQGSCKNHTDNVSIGLGTTDTNDEIIYYKNEEAKNIYLNGLKMLTREIDGNVNSY